MAPIPTFELMDRVFRGLKIQYPTFYRGFSEEDILAAKKFWAIKLQTFDEERILETLMKCPETFPDHAPKIGEFLQACRRIPAHIEYKAPRIEYVPTGNKARDEAMASIDKLVERKTISPKKDKERTLTSAEEAKRFDDEYVVTPEKQKDIDQRKRAAIAISERIRETGK